VEPWAGQGVGVGVGVDVGVAVGVAVGVGLGVGVSVGACVKVGVTVGLGDGGRGDDSVGWAGVQPGMAAAMIDRARSRVRCRARILILAAILLRGDEPSAIGGRPWQKYITLASVAEGHGPPKGVRCSF
jgi:hypothetical protein